MSVAPLKFHVDDAEVDGSVIRALGERSPEQAAPARSTKTRRRRVEARIIGRAFPLFRGVVGRGWSLPNGPSILTDNGPPTTEKWYAGCVPLLCPASSFRPSHIHSLRTKSDAPPP